jgi:CheY-like chemotaxis protein
VEAIPPSAAALEDHLAGAGCTLTRTPDGETALQRLAESEESFHLVLISLQIPAAYDAIRLLRTWEQAGGQPRMPVVALAAQTLPEAIERAIQAGADGYLAAPIDREMLLDAVEWYRRAADISAVRVQVPNLLGELAPVFLRRQRMGLFTAACALKIGDFGAAQTFAHNLKGSGRSYGFPRLSDAAREMERAARDRDAATLGRQIHDLREYLTAVEIE